MKRSPLFFSLLLACCLGATVALAPAAAVTQLSGNTAGGAFFRVLVPDDWTPADGLVIWNHGFDLSPVGPLTDADMGPLFQLQLSQGYAVAASSYSLTGWAVFETDENNADMLRKFADAFGQPEFIIVTGASLGGIVTAQDVEKGLLPNVVGAMPICGALAGSRLWDAGLDLRLLYDVVCADVPGAAIPGGANGLPFPPDPSFTQEALALAVNQCFGILAPPAARTPEQMARLAKFLDVTGIPESFVLTDMGFSTFGLANLVYDPRKLNGRSAMENVGVDYGDEEINENIARVEADPYARRHLYGNYTPTGAVGAAKIVSLHTDKDGLVIVENESDYASKVPAANLTTAIVVEEEPSHCGFTAAEVIAGWEGLRSWLAGAPQPDAAALQGICQQVEFAGLAEGPCRIDPTFVVPSLDVRTRPRDDGSQPPACQSDATTLCLNDGRFQARVAWRALGTAGPGRTVPQTADTGTFWFFNPDNYEVTLKVLDGRSINGHFWVFYGSLTDVEFTLTVTDTVTGAQKVYTNPQGTFASTGDTRAF